jgi:hypothetical protein
MQTANAPSGDSLSISSATTSAPRRRGRPRKHQNDSAKKAAYRARVRVRRLAKERRAYERKVRAGLIIPQRDYLLEAKEAWLNGDTKLALQLFEQLPSEEQAAYDWQIAQEERRASKPIKHNRKRPALR